MSRSDNTEPLLDKEQQLDAALEELFTREKFYEEKRTAAAIAEYDYRIKKAVSYKVADGAVELRKMLADEMSAAEMKARFIADAESDIAKEKLLDVRAAVSARQSILNAETRRPI